MMRFLSRFKWIMTGCFLIALAVGTGIFRKKSIQNLGRVARDHLIQRVTIAGAVIPKRKTLISAPYNGYVKKMYVQVGQTVKPGDPIVSVAQSLRASDGELHPLRAPFPGTIVQILKNEGEFIETNGPAGNTLVRIDDLSSLFVEASAPEIEVGKLKVGQSALIKASAVFGDVYHGEIQKIFLAAKEQKDWDKSRVEFTVIIHVSDKDARLKPGMSVIIDITVKELDDVLVVQHEFLQKDGNKYYITTDQNVKKEVQVGIQNEEVFEIKSGTFEGEKIQQTDFLSMAKED